MKQKHSADNENEFAGISKDIDEVMTKDMTENNITSEQEQDLKNFSEDSPNGADNTGSEEEFEKESTRQAFTRRLNEAKAEIEAKYKGYDDLLNTLKELGVEGKDTQELIYALKGGAEDSVSADKEKQHEDDKSKELKALNDHPDVLAAREAKQKADALIAESIFRSDLEDIKKAYPNVKAKDVFELGDVYISLMKQGNMTPIAAYAAQIAVNNVDKKDKPASMGGIKADSTAQKEYISSNEYDKMVSEDPKLLDSKKFRDIVRRSMSKW